jgi:hypothetical protein
MSISSDVPHDYCCCWPTLFNLICDNLTSDTSTSLISSHTKATTWPQNHRQQAKLLYEMKSPT